MADELKRNCALCMIILLAACVSQCHGHMSSVVYQRQCMTEVTGGVPHASQSAVRCAETCTKMSPLQCHGFIYNTQSRSCQLLQRASVSECLCDSGQPGTHIMVIM